VRPNEKILAKSRPLSTRIEWRVAAARIEWLIGVRIEWLIALPIGTHTQIDKKLLTQWRPPSIRNECLVAFVRIESRVALVRIEWLIGACTEWLIALATEGA